MTQSNPNATRDAAYTAYTADLAAARNALDAAYNAARVAYAADLAAARVAYDAARDAE